MMSVGELRSHIYEVTKDSRILSVDFGTVRVGIATCDALHISISPKGTLLYSENNFWDKFLEILATEKISAIVVGMPEPNNNTTEISITHKKILTDIEKFIFELRNKTNLPVFTHDESFSSKRAVETMLMIGKKKKERAKKGTTDKIAAAVILQNFIEFYNL